MLGGALMVVGNYLPWANLRSGLGWASYNGLEFGDGVITLVLGVGIFLIGTARFLRFAEPSGLLRFATPLVGGIISLIIAFRDGSYINANVRGINNELVYTTTGDGLWVVGVGAVLSIAAALAFRIHLKSRVPRIGECR